HFFLQTKGGPDEPWIMTGLLAWLAALRLGWRPAPAGLLAAAGVALGEAAFYGLKTGIDPPRGLAAGVTGAAGPRPAWVVLAIGLALALAVRWRRSRMAAQPA